MIQSGGLHVIVAQQGGNEPIAQDLAQAVKEAAGAALSFQELMLKGKCLKQMEMALSALGMQRGCPGIISGQKSNPKEEVGLKKLKNMEQSVEKIADHLKELRKECTGSQQGFLAKGLQAEAACKLDAE